MSVLSALSNIVVAFGIIQGQVDTDWVLIGNTAKAKYEVLKASTQEDVGTSSVQFLLRYTFNTPQGEIKTVLEPTIVLCKQNVLITVAQIQFNVAGIEINSNSVPTVHNNPKTSGVLLTELHNAACQNKKSPKENQKDVLRPGFMI
jgi:hypothetical protein